ncbi:hypothetical protein KFK09_026602 [Dendrobium nobile]|uniref:Uncharacterized protein n=1 Tax=Dendrobium nobile TaxID=94219 RepID=A0A8T3A8M8_DENNO|nr:hypothetical protein KFK09_026602 [Dendrobium nobile]
MLLLMALSIYGGSFILPSFSCILIENFKYLFGDLSTQRDVNSNKYLKYSLGTLVDVIQNASFCSFNLSLKILVSSILCFV